MKHIVSCMRSYISQSQKMGVGSAKGSFDEASVNSNWMSYRTSCISQVLCEVFV